MSLPTNHTKVNALKIVAFTLVNCAVSCFFHNKAAKLTHESNPKTNQAFTPNAEFEKTIISTSLQHLLAMVFGHPLDACNIIKNNKQLRDLYISKFFKDPSAQDVEKVRLLALAYLEATAQGCLNTQATNMHNINFTEIESIFRNFCKYDRDFQEFVQFVIDNMTKNSGSPGVDLSKSFSQEAYKLITELFSNAQSIASSLGSSNQNNQRQQK